MSDISELEHRLQAALERAEAALAALPARPEAPQPAGADPQELESLREQLESERTANAQLEARVGAITEKQEKLVAGLEAEVARLREELSARDDLIQRVKQVNHKLRSNNRALREAQKAGAADAVLINASLEAELEALRSTQEAERAELDAILGDLKPLLEGETNA